jgi:ABC-type nitrate/sulfonate/bicarbonate transport system substrate-binding protein
MVDLAAEQIPWLFSSLVVRRGDLTSRRDLHKRFLKATIEGNYLALSDAARAKEVLAKELKITDAKILGISYEDFKQQSPPDTEPSRAGAENILTQFPGGSSKLDDYIDVSLLDEIKAEGFLDSLRRTYLKQ